MTISHSILQQLTTSIRAGYSCFYLHTAETARAEFILQTVANELKFNVQEYNLAQGKIRFANKEPQKENNGRIEQSLNELFDEDLEKQIILIKNAKLALENNPIAIARLQHLIEKIERHYSGECAVILQAAEVYIPADLEPFINLIELPLPQNDQIKNLVSQHFPNIENEILSMLATALSGLNENEIQKLLVLIKQRFNEQLNTQNEGEVLAEIQRQKEQIIAKSGVLEMVKVNEKLEDIGGLENLKKWLKDQHQVLSHLDEALEFGVKAPKGALIAGMPGCGKSLTAKATASLFQQPLLRLDIGSLLGKYVGESETNMRRALAMAESISPCVLWVDELEKAFVGMTGNNASEVSSRLLGYFLTWLQEKSKPVFILATANDITALPPELLRKGRFDEIFYVGFPNQAERKKILEIHLKKAKQKAESFDLNELARLCRDYAGADIENAVYESVKSAFLSPEKSLTAEKLKQAIKNTVPLRKTLKDKVGEYEKKFDELYLTPASQNDGLGIAQMVKMAKDPNYLERKKVAEHEDVTEDILADLVKDKELDVRKAAFSNPNCPTKLLDEQISLKTDSALYHKEILDIIVKHSNVSFPLAIRICKSNNSYIDELVKNADLSLEENQQALMENEYTQGILAKQERIHLSLQPKLIAKSSLSINQELARNLYLSQECYQKLIEFNNEDVQITMAKYNTNSEILLVLSNSSNVQVTNEIGNRKDLSLDIKVQLAKNTKISKSLQSIL
ncbi:AAA family ATPase, partial [Ursidibacter sp. B-7004-1]